MKTLKTYVLRARDSRNLLIKKYVEARSVQQARELFKNMYPGLRIETVILKLLNNM